MKTRSKTVDKPSVLMIGPCPPPFGGVATVVKSLSHQGPLLERFDMSVYRIGRRDRGTSSLAQMAVDLVRFLKFPFAKESRVSDIVHIHTASYWSFVRTVPYVVVSRYMLGSRVILHIHGARFHLFHNDSGKLMRYVIRKTLLMSDAIIVTSPSWIDLMNRIMARPGVPVFALPNGFAADVFYPRSVDECREKLNLPKDKRILVTIGHLEDYKGHRYLVDAMKLVASERADVVAYIIGNGSLKDDLSKQISEAKVEGNVILEGGSKPDEEIPLWMNACDVFVLPSLNEGNPTVMFEALGCQKPFIGTKVGGVPDVITSEEYGLLAEPGDSRQLAQNILESLKRRWDGEKIGRYAAQFSWSDISKRIVDIYESVINAR